MSNALNEQHEMELPGTRERYQTEERIARLRAAGIRPATQSLARPRRAPARRESRWMRFFRRLFG